MEKLILAGLFCAIAVAGPSTTNDKCVEFADIKTAFTTAGADVVTSVSEKSVLIVKNSTDVAVQLCYNSATAAGCAASNPWTFEPGETFARDNLKIANTVWLRYLSAPSSGRVCVGTN